MAWHAPRTIGGVVTYILPGRHQPPHNDHFEIVRRALVRIEGKLFVGLIVHPKPGEALTSFEREAQRQNGPDRAPFTFCQRLRMFEVGCAERLSADEQARVRIVPLPRPEVSWSIVQATYPGQRVWVVPSAGEAFDEEKVRFFLAQGDQVLRIPLEPTTDGRLVRALIERGDAKLSQHVPRSVASWIIRFKGGEHERQRP